MSDNEVTLNRAVSDRALAAWLWATAMDVADDPEARYADRVLLALLDGKSAPQEDADEGPPTLRP